MEKTTKKKKIEKVELEEKLTEFTEETDRTISIEVLQLLNFRESPNTTSEVLLILEKGTILDATKENEEWYKIDYNGKTGYVSSSFVKVIG